MRRVLGFNIPGHAKLVDLQESKSPVVLRNLKQGSNHQDLLFNQSSSADVALPVDVDFPYTAIEPPVKDQGPPTISITLGSLQTMKPMQKVSVVATLTYGDVEPKSVTLKTNIQTRVKEDCMLEDPTGSAVLHIWDPNISKLQSGKTYHFQQLMVRQFLGSIHLSTTMSTSFEEADQQIENVSGPTLLATPIIEMCIEEITFVSHLDIHLSCQSCNRKIAAAAEGKSLKCQQCGVRQRTANCRKDASVTLTVDAGNGISKSLKAFSGVFFKLLALANVSADEKTDVIEEALLELQNITLKVEQNKNRIVDVFPADIKTDIIEEHE